MGVMQRVVVSGRVRQVGYRDWITRQAYRLGITGWIRARSDTSVEMLAEGDAAALEAFLAASRQGPMLARVEDVVAQPADDRAVRGFTKRLPL
ncbi:acylphosphatase [Sphingomonas guangdongensis]|uniref:acylphosphatase n=1 Tax=Sphingomonas guangdongensis TaxID=1141890 RepID=A0A285R1B5_9SPHN|nr:acylphosphatase [Sphingomonas guangdongensis]SOB87900.1 acylphosphatase [Sphingomonas guangdongensis]